jgi:hypothetical protein
MSTSPASREAMRRRFHIHGGEIDRAERDSNRSERYIGRERDHELRGSPFMDRESREGWESEKRRQRDSRERDERDAHMSRSNDMGSAYSHESRPTQGTGEGRGRFSRPERIEGAATWERTPRMRGHDHDRGYAPQDDAEEEQDWERGGEYHLDSEELDEDSRYALQGDESDYEFEEEEDADGYNEDRPRESFRREEPRKDDYQSNRGAARRRDGRYPSSR